MKQLRRGPKSHTKARPGSMGWRIHKLRLERRLTQKELAELVGVGQAAVSAWECGKLKRGLLPASTLKMLSAALGVSEAYLAKGRERGDRAAEGPGLPVLALPPVPAQAEVMRLSRQGLAAEALSLAQAKKAMQEAVQAGRQVWLVVS